MAKKSSKQKRYFWLKLKEDWFSGTTEKYLKSLPAGDSLLITYLKIQLMSLKTEGFLKYERLLPSAEEEIAMLIDEPVNNVRLLINVLLKTGAIERLDDNSLYLLSLQNLIGSEGSSTDRVRRFRERQKALQCNNNQLQIEGEILGNSELDVENLKALQCNDNVMQDVTDENLKILQNLDLKTQRYNVTPMKRNGNGEKELDLEKEQEPNGTTLDYTTLNIIFNYINKYELKKQLDLSLTEEEQKEHARMFLVINTLKKLELYMTDKTTFEIMTEERQKDLLIQYYVIDEFSKSPYNFLLYKLNTENFRDDSRIKVDEGFIRLYDRYDISEKLDEADIKKKGSFFMLNGKYIWYNDELLTGDIELLAQMSCKIKVLGYKMNCLEQDEEIIKAIAMFIE